MTLTVLNVLRRPQIHAHCAEEEKIPFTCSGNRTQHSRVVQPVDQSLHLLSYPVSYLKHGTEISLAAILPHRKYHQFPWQCHRWYIIIITLKFWMHSTLQNAASGRGKEMQEIKTPLHNGALHQSCTLQRISCWVEVAFHKENLQIQMELNVNTVRTAGSWKSNGCQITPRHFVNGNISKKQQHVTAIH